jgi:16S rRNA (cytosine1402-N4)-methyltransferase
MAYQHVPVLRERVVEMLAQGPAEIVVDATVGLGGHSEAILEALPDVQVVGLDVDTQALDLAAARLKRFGNRVRLVRGSYAKVDACLQELGMRRVSGVLLDLGVSSLQIDAPERGFSYLRDGPLDMRMDPTAPRTAADLINTSSEHELTRVFQDYGEERWARRIARAIARRRDSGALTTTSELADVIRQTISGRKPVSTLARVFQSVRMWVNGEMENLREGLGRSLGVLAPGSILVVLSYHSLEDRMVKQFFRRQVQGCVCPPDLPKCACGFVARFQMLTRGAVRATEAERESNVRARGARLRAVQRAW